MDDSASSKASEDDGRAIEETNYDPIGEDGNSEGTAGSEETDSGADSGEHDTAGESATSGGSQGDAGQDISDSGDSVDEAQVYEGVNPSQFDEAIEGINQKLDGLNASTIVLVFALFLCAGIVSVNTLVRSLEWRE